MNDRELLELAAKAAGIDAYWGQRSHQMVMNGQVGGHEYPEPIYWNPLTDDGDALRLAVKLAICVKHEDAHSVSAGWVRENFVPFTLDQRGPWFWKEWLRDNGNDRLAATRRAIVRAAAEIGKEFK